jgi:hypothetical protein
MAPIDDQTLDRLLTRHAASKLDRHLGRAEAAFRASLAQEIAPIAAQEPARPPLRIAGGGDIARSPRQTFWERFRRNSGWFAGLAGTALAASLATLFLLPHLTGIRPIQSQGRLGSTENPPPTVETAQAPPIATSDHPMVRYIYNQAVNDGTATDAFGRPQQRVRYQQVEHYRYYDPQRKAMVDIVVPREDVEHYQLDTY